MNISKVDPLPHQIEGVYGYVLKLPRIRFLIADDPGAGKTIMAGLIIKELKLRHLIKKILIVTPGHLKDQWRRELSEKFEEKFVVVDRGYLDALYGENVWLRENHIITSIDFAKREEILPSIAAAHFDLIIVDEAHKMSAYRYGDKTEKTSRYRLGEALSHNSDHLLFLTATPHKGDPENFRLFLDLLEPGFFATNEMVENSIKNKDNPLFIRRIKEDLVSFEDKPLFLPRYVKTVSFNLGTNSKNEKILYNALSKYVETQYNKALTRDKKRNVAFKNPDAEFVSFGHPLFESVMVWIENSLADAILNGATFIDPDGKIDGHILFYEGEIRDGTGAVAGKRLFGFYVCDTEIKPISPAIIWDLAEGQNDKNEKGLNHEEHEGHEGKNDLIIPVKESEGRHNTIPLSRNDLIPPIKGGEGGCNTIDIDGLKKRVSGTAIAKLEEYKQKLMEERIRQAEIKQKYGIKSLEYLVVKIDGELIALYSRKNQGENVDLVIRNKEERKADYENAAKQLKEQIQREKSLTMDMPRFVGMIKVKPAIKVDKGMQSDAEVEKTGMEIAKKYETENGRTPEDVSAENLGFDIRSTVKDGTIRYIEVKARAESGGVALTQNEWFKAKRFKDDYYLYTILNAGRKPELYIIQNPAENLNVNEKIESVRYIIDQGEIKSKSKNVV